MASYKFLYDENELKKFVEKINSFYKLENDEVIYIALFSRNKYLSEEEKKFVDLARSNVVNRQICRGISFEEISRAIGKMECREGSFIDRSGNGIPNKCLIPYFSFNPVSPIDAFNDTQRCFVEYILEIEKSSRKGRTDKSNTYSRLQRIDAQYMSQLQHATSRSVIVDIDFDIPYDKIDFIKMAKEKFDKRNLNYFIVDTRSGFHVLIEKASIKYDYNVDLDEIRAEAEKRFGPEKIHGVKKPVWDISKNKNEAIPLPGTMQFDHVVKIYEE